MGLNKEYSTKLKLHLKLEERGFQELIDPTEFYQNLYVSEKGNARYFLNFSIFQHKLYALSCWIELNEVEELLNSLLLKYNLTEREPLTTLTISSYKFLQNEEFKKKLNEAQEIRLTDNDAIGRVASLMLDYINGEFEPFWQKYSELSNVNEIINTVELKDIHLYLPGDYIDLRKLIIMKLCNNPGYEAYRDWLMNFEERDFKNEPPKYEKRYRMFSELVRILEGH